LTRPSEVKQFLLTDQVGTLRAVADTSGAIVKRIDYDSFGNIIADSNPGFSVPFGFAGGLHDRDTGLVRFGFRDYDPAIGRFVAKDPIDFAGGDTNLYAYVMNDPVNYIDPRGLDFLPLSDVEDRIGRVEGILDDLRGGREPRRGGRDNATTRCWFGFPSTNLHNLKLPQQILACVKEHEEVHQDQCRSDGMWDYILGDKTKRELPAYERELKCLQQCN
jgi:RHS repeat-associated protein